MAVRLTEPLPGRLSLRWTRWRMALPVVVIAALLAWAVIAASDLPSPWSALCWTAASLLLVPLIYASVGVIRPTTAVVMDSTGLEVYGPFRRLRTVVLWNEVNKAEVVHVFRRGYFMMVHLTGEARGHRAGHVVVPVTPFDAADLGVPVSDVGLSPEQFACVVSHYAGIKVGLSTPTGRTDPPR